MIHIEIKSPKFSRTGLARLGSWFKERVQRMSADAYTAAKQPQKRRTLQTRTGKLMGSIRRVFRQRGQVIEAGVASSHPGAAALEYGATIPPRVVEARMGEVLRFTVGGQVVYRRLATIPTVTIPPHPFLTPSVRKAARSFRSEVRAEIRRVAGTVVGRGT